MISLTRSCASHNADFFLWFNIDSEFIEDYRGVLPVSHAVVFKGYGTLLWPACPDVCILDSPRTLGYTTLQQRSINGINRNKNMPYIIRLIRSNITPFHPNSNV